MLAFHYFHDPKNKTVWKAEISITSEYSKHKPARYLACRAHANVRFVSVTGLKSAGGGVTHVGGYGANQGYANEGDTPERAKEMFLANHLGLSTYEKIEEPEFRKLEAQYRAEAGIP